MFAQPTKKRMKGLVSATIVLILVVAFITPATFARIVRNTVDSVATVTDNGRQIIVTGPMACIESQRADLRVTVTQRSTGAVAEGRALVTCTGDTLQWEVHVLIQGKETFEEGPAIAVAIASTSDRGDTDDAHQWLVSIRLVRE